MRNARRWLVALSSLLAASTLDQEVMDIDPAQYADVARHIVDRGDWLRLRDMNGPFVNKPPLMMQAQAVGLLALGRSSSVAIRVPAWLFFLLTVAGTWWLGALLRGPELGLDAAVLVSGSVALHQMVADPKVDLALTAMVTCSVACFVAGLKRAPGFTIAGWAFAGLAVLSKGPVGVFLVAGAVGVTLLRERAKAAWWAHALGMVALLAVVSPFYRAMAEAGGESTLRYLLWSQGPGRLVGAGGEFHDSTTPLFVLHTAAWALLPMSPLVGWALLRRTRVHALPVWWLVTSLLAVALAAFRLPQYVYWAAPAAALVGAEALEGFPRWCSIALASLSVVAGLLVLSVMFTPGPLAFAGLVVVLVAPLAWCVRTRSASVRVSLGTLGFLGLVALWLHPSLLAYQPSRELAEAVAKEGANRVQLCEVPRSFSLDFYVQPELIDRASEELQPGLAIVSGDLADRLAARATVLGRWPSYPVSLPRWPFLRAATREQQVSTVALVRLTGP